MSQIFNNNYKIPCDVDSAQEYYEDVSRTRITRNFIPVQCSFCIMLIYITTNLNNSILWVFFFF